MTGIDIETIEKHGVSIETIQTEIIDFFGPNTVLIGQNIWFDIGFLKKFFPWCVYDTEIDTYPLAASSIPYLKSYSLESIDTHLTEQYNTYKDKKQSLLTALSDGKTLSAHDALYDCINGICLIQRWKDQLTTFQKEFPIIQTVLHNTQWEGIITILEKEQSLWHKEQSSQKENQLLPILTSPLITEKKSKKQTIINREKTPQHSKRSTKNNTLQETISELPHPCIIAVSHGSKIDIIKKHCPDEQFDYLKEEQIIDQKKLSLFLNKAKYTQEEFLFVVFYLSHHRDGYRIINPTITTHKYILDYLQIKKTELKKDKKILCSHGWLYYTMQNNPERSELYKDYPICILDADRWHTTYNDYAQRWMWLTTILYQREKYEYEIQQLVRDPEDNESNSNDHNWERNLWYYETTKTIINSLTFFITHFIKESEKKYHNLKQYKREIDYLLNHQSYINTAQSREAIRELRTTLITESTTTPQYLIDTMNKLSNLFQNPLKIQRNINQNKDVYYNIAPSVRYIDFAEYLKMFGTHKVVFFSPTRPEYTTFLPTKNTQTQIPITYEENLDRTLSLIKKTEWSIFIVSHNSDKSKKLFAALHEGWFEDTHTLIGEHLTGWVAKNAIKQTTNKPNIIIGGYHMLLHFWGEGNKIDHVVICYVHAAMKSFINDDIQQYAIK